MKQTIKLENLSCQNCVKHVTKHFEQLAGVSEVTIDLASQTALVETSQAHSPKELAQISTWKSSKFAYSARMCMKDPAPPHISIYFFFNNNVYTGKKNSEKLKI